MTQKFIKVLSLNESYMYFSCRLNQISNISICLIFVFTYIDMNNNASSFIFILKNKFFVVAFCKLYWTFIIIASYLFTLELIVSIRKFFMKMFHIILFFSFNAGFNKNFIGSIFAHFS